MKHNLLITRPNFDVTTRYLFVWAKKIIELAEKKCGKIFDLKKQRANRKEFESVMRKHEPGLAFLNGHGDERTVAGQDNEALIRAGENEEILKAKNLEQGKKPEMIEKIVDGQIRKFLAENCLLDQSFVKNPDLKVSDYMKEASKKAGGDLTIKRFVRFELGAGIEKKVVDFAAEVAEQTRNH